MDGGHATRVRSIVITLLTYALGRAIPPPGRAAHQLALQTTDNQPSYSDVRVLWTICG